MDGTDFQGEELAAELTHLTGFAGKMNFSRILEEIDVLFYWFFLLILCFIKIEKKEMRIREVWRMEIVKN